MRFPAFLLASSFAVGCAHSAVLLPANAEQRVDGQVDIVVHDVRSTPVIGTNSDVVAFTVENLSREPMTVDRDAVYLEADRARIARLPGGAHTLYTIAPGELHDVNVRFPVDELTFGRMVAVHFDEAVTIGGQRIAVAPITFQVH